MVKQRFLLVMTYIITIMSLFGFQQMAMAEYVAEPGKNYALIKQPSNPLKGKSDKVEVISIFSYTCSHCNRIDPLMTTWAKENSDKVEFIPLALPGNGAWETYSKIYYTLEALKKLELGHRPVYDAIFKNRKTFANPKQAAKFLSPIIGVDEDAFLKTWDSFAVKTAYNRAAKVLTELNVNYTPAFIVDGKYFIDVGIGSQNQSGSGDVYQKTVSSINDLVDEIIKNRTND